jgi:cellulose synthase/poly-beta-1,6-N-acetylglucosamine synthase-like glycosyltransferase
MKCLLFVLVVHPITILMLISDCHQHHRLNLVCSATRIKTIHSLFLTDSPDVFYASVYIAKVISGFSFQAFLLHYVTISLNSGSLLYCCLLLVITIYFVKFTIHHSRPHIYSKEMHFQHLHSSHSFFC